MSIDRRQLCKMFALSPFLGLGGPGLLEGLAMAGPAPCDCVSVLLHGLFFLEFQNGMLIAASPEYTGHCVRYRDHGDPLGPLPTPPTPIVDLNGKLTAAASPPPFAPELLQFKASDITKRTPFIDLAKKYAFLLKLPYPQRIFALRSGSASDFHPDPTKNVTGALKKSLGAKVGIIAWLQYAQSPRAGFITRSYFAEHGSLSVPYQEVNRAFGAARKVFPEFDLQLANGANATIARDQQNQLPPEISPDDERALGEMTTNNCTALNASAASIAAQHAPKKSGNADQRKAVSVEVATCPQFGILP